LRRHEELTRRGQKKRVKAARRFPWDSSDSEAAHEKLINSRLAYVAVSRARYGAQIYTNDAQHLGEALSRETSHAAALAWDGDGKSNGAGSGDHGGEEKGHGSEHGHAAEESHGHAMAME
jgi:hypothetical protein